MGELLITAPMAGWAAPLDEVPDAVFAQRMLGDGVAIHPLDDLVRAPCDGTVVSIHDAGHAVTIRAAGGAELLIHVGLETVALAGAGFVAHVAVGASVARGDALIGFDPALIADRAPSLVTPIVLVDGDAFAIVRPVLDRAVGAGDPLMTIVPRSDQVRDAAAVGATARRDLVVPLVHGLHARPAARIAALARAHDAEIELVAGDRRAAARSPIALLAMAVRHGESVTVEARGGAAAAAAVAAVAALIESGMDETAPAVAPAATSPTAPAAPVDGAIAGIGAAPGLAAGAAFRLVRGEIVVPRDGTTPDAERRALDAAIASVAAGIAATAPTTPAAAAILEAHRGFLEDESLRDAARAEIAAGCGAGHGWRAAIRAQVDRLRASGNARTAERADDLLDLERRVLVALGGEATATAIPAGAILIAADLLPSDLIGIDRGAVAGIALEGGGPTSHVAILAAGLGIPALVACGSALGGIAGGTPLLIDADAGRLHLDPDADARAAFDARMVARRRIAAEAAAHAAELCRARDGTRIELFANLGSLDDARAAVTNGAEGCGLLRTEFLFVDRRTPPTEEEQAADYATIAAALEGRPLIVRLLDIGGDKQAPYLPGGPEENPALGLRGIRVSLADPALLATQLRAILRAGPPGQCRIMAPMIASLAELRAVRVALDAARADLAVDAPVPLGVMIETPAAAVTADLIAAEADFLSIGTNDLTQYALAMDRGNPAVAAGVDALHPAVLRLIERAAAGGTAHGRVVGVCGGLASDPLGIPLLVGLGVTELSVTPAFVPEAKALMRRLDPSACRALAADALALAGPGEVRALVAPFIEELS